MTNNTKLWEWILEEQFKGAIIGIVKEGVGADAAMEIAVRVMRKVIGEATQS